MNRIIFVYILFLLISCKPSSVPASDKSEDASLDMKVTSTSIVVLGTAQDAGAPQIGCRKKCCKRLFESGDYSHKVVSLGLIDPKSEQSFLFEATPDLVRQTNHLNELCNWEKGPLPDGIFITHAHIGHYSGLMYLGKEAINTNKMPVYVMPKMRDFLKNNGPWNQLVNNENIVLHSLSNKKEVSFSDRISIEPFIVPHRDEYSETVGYKINGPNKKALFIPDIDKWEKWDEDIVTEIKNVDYAFIDATFYNAEEINNRDISEIPHPFVIESLEKFKTLDSINRQKVVFIHFNHTNPLLDSISIETQYVLSEGYDVARIGKVYAL